jgi:hypothetical protein
VCGYRADVAPGVKLMAADAGPSPRALDAVTEQL